MESKEIDENRYAGRMTRLQRGVWVWKFFARIIEKALPVVQRKKKVVSEPTDPLLLISAKDLAEKLRKKEIKCVEIVALYIQRIKDVNVLLNAVLEDRFEAALDDARAADDLIENLSETELALKYPLLGVPCTIKEQLKVKGLSFECGLNSRKGIKAEADSPAVKAIRDAGAIVLCVSSIPELCCSYETHHLRYGRTLNPYDTSRTPGGSSGGEAALQGAGASPFGIGSDFFGSIRIPAAFTGVFGLRPTSGLLNTSEVIPSSQDEQVTKLLSFGPMVRYAKDLTFLLKVLSGEKSRLVPLDQEVKVHDLRIIYLPEYSQSVECVIFDDDVIAVIETVVNHFKESGSNVIEMPSEVNLECLFEKCMARIHHLPRRALIEWSDISKKPDIMWGIYKEIFKWCCFMSDHTMIEIFTEFIVRGRDIGNKEQTAHFTRLVDKLETQLEEILDDNTVLIFPTFPKKAFYHYGIMCYGTGIQYVLLPSIMNFPAVSVPMGLSKDGLPLSVQVIAGRYRDHLCIAVAQHLEQVFGGWVPPGSTRKTDLKSVNVGK